MNNRNRLQRIVEGLGYDEGLERVMVKGINALSESSVSNTLRSFVAYQESMPEILNKVAAFIAEAESQPSIVVKAGVPRSARKMGRQPESFNSNRESVQETASTKEIAVSVEVDSPAVISTALLDLTIAYANIMATTIEAWSALFRVWLPSDFDSENLPKPDVYANVGMDAVRRAIAAATSAFDRMNEESRRISEMAEAKVGVANALVTPKQIAGQRTKERISSRK